MLLTWQRREGGVRSEERGGECVKEAAVRAALKGVELEVAARRRGVGRSAVPEGGEEAVSRRDAFAFF